MRIKIKITEEGKLPYIQEVNEKIAKIYLAKENPRVKYELLEEAPKEAKKTKIELGSTAKKEVK